MSASPDTKATTRLRWVHLGLPVALLACLSAAYTAAVVVFWLIAEIHESGEALLKIVSIFGSAFTYAQTGHPLEITASAGLPLSFTIFRIFAISMFVASAFCRTLVFFNDHDWIDSTDGAYDIMNTGSKCALWSGISLTVLAVVVVLA